jgi:hypothetical protein
MRGLANSVPKSGTHLLFRLLELLDIQRYRTWRLDPEWTLERSLSRRLRMDPRGAKEPLPIGRGVIVSAAWARRVFRAMPEDQAILGHCAYSPQVSTAVIEGGLRTICIVRDPRDVAVSHAHFIMRIGKKRITRKPEHQALVALPDNRARILAMLRGPSGKPSIAESFREFKGWHDHPDVCFVRFEDLVGARGGGDGALQRESIRRFLDFLGMSRTAEQVETICSSLFGNTGTFRKGTIGQWRQEFGPEQRAAAKETLADVLETYGYPTE